jgi:ketosteroid isomerase-like protein
MKTHRSPLVHRIVSSTTLLILCGPLGAVLQAQVTAQAPSKVKEEIQAIETEWAKAYQTKDSSIFSRILGEEYYEFSADDGKRSSKQDEIEGLKASKVVLSSMTNTVQEVRLYGEVAIALGENHSKGSENGKAFDRRYSWQTVFVKRAGRWVAVVAHVSEMRIPKK